MNDMTARLARACARGTRQLGFVNELLAGEGYLKDDPWGYATLGDSRLGRNSWKSLRTRLIENGFIIKFDDTAKRGKRAVELRFSV